MLLSVTDGKVLRLGKSLLKPQRTSLCWIKNTRQEGELEDRPQKGVLNVDLRNRAG